MAVTKRAPIPHAPIGVAGKDLKGNPVVNANDDWMVYFRDQDTAIDATAQPVATPISSPDRNTAQATTDIVTAPQSSGLYSFQFYESVNVADGGGASLITTLGWTENAVPKTHVFSTLDGSIAASNLSDIWMFFADAGAPITYANAYASTTPGLFRYNFYAVLNSVAGAT